MPEARPEPEQWYWCLDHQEVEAAGSGCALDRKLGPFPSPAEARRWKQKFETRNEAWDEEDRRWEGDE